MADPRWYLLIHQVPARPLYLRAKVRERLAKAGALALKDSVYLLPRRDDTLDRFEAVAEEVVTGGGRAYLCAADFMDPADERSAVHAFREERRADYRSLAADLRNVLDAAGRRPLRPGVLRLRLTRARKRLAAIGLVDYFAAPGRGEARRALGALEQRLAAATAKPARGEWRGRTWVTRRGVQIDRIASAWLIRRFLDGAARIRFLASPDDARPGEIRFDMVGGDFSHEGDRCTFETLLARVGPRDPALARIAEIVHDVDLKDGKYRRPEARGVEQLVLGIVKANADDDDRLARGFELFDDLYASFSRARP